MNFSFDFFTEQLAQLRDGQAIVDVILVSLVIFVILRLIQGTRAVQVLNGFFIVVAILYIIFSASQLQLIGLNWLIQQILPILFIAIPVIFQPELRRAFEQVGGAGRYLKVFQRSKPNPALDAVVQAGRRLSQRRHGALIVFEQNTGLQEYVDTGVMLNAAPSSELLLTIFNKNTELHDGAMIVRNGKVVAAACVLPLSAANVSDRQMGLRHRAALGISEVSDAVSLIISEETGQFAITHNGRILRRQDPDRLHEIMTAFLQDNIPGQSGFSLRQLFRISREQIQLTRILGTLFSNLFSLVLSIMLGVIIWSAAEQSNNPITTKSLLLDIKEKGVLQAEGTVTLEDRIVRITIRGPESIVNPLVSSDFEAYIDRSSLPFGESVANILVDPLIADADSVDIDLIEPSITNVVAEQIISKEIPVVVDLRGEAALGHELGEVVTDPSTIVVTGPENQVNQLREASVTVFLESPNEDVVRVRPPSYTNIFDQRTGVSGLSTSADEVRITIPINVIEGVKNLPIRVAIEGEPQEGYQLLGFSVEPNSVLVRGLPSTLNGFSSISTESVDISGATENVSIPIALELPEDVALDANESPSVFVNINIEPIFTSDIIRMQPEIRALTEGLTATLQTEEITIFLFGPLQTLNSLTEEDVNVTVDLLNLEAGTHTVQPLVTVNIREIEVRSIQPESVTVVIERVQTLEEQLEAFFGDEFPDGEELDKMTATADPDLVGDEERPPEGETGTPNPDPSETPSGSLTPEPAETPLATPTPAATPTP